MKLRPEKRAGNCGLNLSMVANPDSGGRCPLPFRLRAVSYGSGTMIALIEPLVTTRRLSGPFDYLWPEGREQLVGSLVKIPFAGRVLDGVVVGFKQKSDVAPDRLATPVEFRSESLPEGLVGLAYWIAQQYCSTPARALTLFLPPQRQPQVQLWAVRTDKATINERLTERQRKLLDSLPAPTGTSLAALRRLEARGFVTITAKKQRRKSLRTDGGALISPPTLTSEQRSVLARIENRIENGRENEKLATQSGANNHFLLYGVTGSGKTEVYLQAAAKVLAAGRTVIILVPEIALTPQTVARFEARFGEQVAILHSAQTAGQRYDEWCRLRSGEARIAIGPRSAVFAPVENLGLIVIDEEHDSSYKHEGDPRYDARAVAQKRATRSHAALIVGSATPRPETWHRLTRLTLSERVDSNPLPTVRILDMRGVNDPLHDETRRALASVDKAIVLLNRRGWSNFLSCRACGKAWECPQCAVTLVVHRGQNLLACHHCGHRETTASQCDECGSVSLARHGAGTEQVESQLTDVLGLSVFRLDADTVKTRDSIPRLLQRFREAKRGVLLGTQMVAKGHDFPDVGLGVVIDADSTLRFPDFRAEERTFALITQLAGRAGRGQAGGEVLVQALAPDAMAVITASKHDTTTFLSGELARRQALSYPPFADLIRVVVSAQDGSATRRAADFVKSELEQDVGSAGDVLGPAVLFRLRGKDRYQVVIKTTAKAQVTILLGKIVDIAARRPEFKTVAFSVDVDPQ